MDKQFKEWWENASKTLKCDQYDAYEIWQQAQKVAIPEGFVLVPREPTKEMIIASFDYRAGDDYCIADIYKAMIEAQEQKND